MTNELQSWADRVRRQARDAGVDLPIDVVEELAVHLRELYEHALSTGETEPAARALAEHALEAATMRDLTLRARVSRHTPAAARGERRLTSRAGIGLWSDARYALRLLRRGPLFAVTVVAVLAIGIGVLTAVFGAVNALLLRPLPYPQPEQLVALQKLDQAGRAGQISAADWLDYSAQVRSFDAVTAYSNWTHNLTGNGEPLRLRSVITAGNFFRVFRRAPALGRVYSEADDSSTADAVVVLSAGFWVRRFGGDPHIVGRTIVLNGAPATVIGVMPESFEFPSRDVDLWMPIGLRPELEADRASEWLRAVARLRAGTTLPAALDEARVVAARLAREYPGTNSGEHVALVALEDIVVGEIRPALLAVGGAVAFVFLITCLNVVDLFLSRASARRDEMTIRLALGASRWRVLRQTFTENALLTLCAGIAGYALAHGLFRGFVALASSRVPRLHDAELGAAGAFMAAAASAVVLVLCAVASALPLTGAKYGVTSGGRIARARGIRPLLLTTQIAVSFVLVTSSLLVAGSYLQLQNVPLGFDADDVLSMRVTLPPARYPDNAAHVRFADAVLREIAALPAVSSAGVINDLPFAGNQMSFAVSWEGRPDGAHAPPRATVRLADSGYFATLRVPLVRGRMLTADDAAGRELVALVNRRAADQYFDGDAIDRRVRVGALPEWRRVVGIVADTRHGGPRDAEGPVIYLPFAQKPFDFINWMGFVVRAPDVGAMAGVLRTRVRTVDPNQPLYDVLMLEDYVARTQAPFRVNAWIVSVLGGVSLILAAAGVFALTSYTVAARREEFGIRLALGASRPSMLRLVLRQSLVLVIAGILAGSAGAAFAMRLLTALLFQMTPTDPRIYAGVASLLFLSALLAALPPAVRAATADPLKTIRAE